MNTVSDFISGSFNQKTLLSGLGLDRENSFVLWLLIFFAALLGGGLYLFDGNVPLVAGIIYLSFVLILSVLRLDLSLYLFMFTVILFDQYAIPGFTSFTFDVRFFHNIKEIPYVPYIHSGVVSPFEIHLLFITVALLMHASIRHSFSFKPIPVWGAFLFFAGLLIFSFVNGMRGGGDIMVALWEVRALFYLCLMYVIVPQILDTREQITALFWVFIIGITIKALQGVAKFVALGFTTGGFDVLTNHEDPVFMITIFILLLGFLVFHTGGKQRAWLLISLFILFLGFYVAQRRATYASLMVSISAFIVLLPTIRRIQFLKYFLPVLFVLLLYGAAFWNNDGTYGRPVQMIKSGFVEPDKETNFRDYSSNLYRDNENYNLARTVVNNPVLGTGFGVKYDQPIPLVTIRFTLSEYIPHNQIYWILVKMGAVGFFAFWFFFNCFAAKGTQLFMRLKDPFLKAVTLVVIIAVINQLVVSFFDLQLTYYRSMLYLGCLMGLLPVISHIESEEKSREDIDNDGLDE
ncbi:MAG: O-antigen ligase family protein [Balneolaceae bacterium]|nr:O-antigen ligase family protein [Balneolaceae bacterium]